MNAKEKLADLQRQFGLYAQANPEVMNGFGATATAAMEHGIINCDRCSCKKM